MAPRGHRRYRVSVPDTYESTLGDLGEDGLLEHLFARIARAPKPTDVPLVGPGDDTAYLRSGAATLATTDVLVRGRDWLDQWSSATDVGVKVVNQNLADLAAMGGCGQRRPADPDGTLIAAGQMGDRVLRGGACSHSRCRGSHCRRGLVIILG